MGLAKAYSAKRFLEAPLSAHRYTLWYCRYRPDLSLVIFGCVAQDRSTARIIDRQNMKFFLQDSVFVLRSTCMQLLKDHTKIWWDNFDYLCTCSVFSLVIFTTRICNVFITSFFIYYTLASNQGNIKCKCNRVDKSTCTSTSRSTSRPSYLFASRWY